MANVGNLFVNISGTTKGLTKALSNAKSQISGFSSKTIKEQQRVVKEAAANAADAARMAAVGARGSMPTRVQTRLQSAQASREYGAAKKELNQMEATKAMRFGLGVIGLTIAGAAMIAKRALSRTDEAISDAKKFEMLGPEGGKILEQRLKMMFDAMEYAGSAKGSAQFLNQATRERNVKAEAYSSGAAGLRQEQQAFMDEAAQGFLRSIFSPIQRLKDVLPVYNLNASRARTQIQGGY